MVGQPGCAPGSGPRRRGRPSRRAPPRRTASPSRLQPERVAGEVDHGPPSCPRGRGTRRGTDRAASRASRSSARARPSCDAHAWPAQPRRRVLAQERGRAGAGSSGTEPDQRARARPRRAGTGSRCPSATRSVAEQLRRCSAACPHRAPASPPRSARGTRAAAPGCPPRTRSGRHSKPCWMRPSVPGNAPPPWAKATRSVGQPLEHAAEDQRADGERDLRRHAHQPRQPVLLHPRLAHHVPGVHEDRGAQLGGRLEHREQRRVAQVPVVDVACRSARPRAPALARSARARAPPAPGPAAARCPGPRSGAGAPATTPARWSLRKRADLEPVLGLRPVAEHHRHGGEHLDAHPRARRTRRAAPPGSQQLLSISRKKLPVVASPSARGKARCARGR